MSVKNKLKARNNELAAAKYELGRAMAKVMAMENRLKELEQEKQNYADALNEINQANESLLITTAVEHGEEKDGEYILAITRPDISDILGKWELLCQADSESGKFTLKAKKR